MFLNSVLPSRNFDQEAGEKRTAVFIQILSDYTKGQIDFMVNAAARELEWFPVPKQMLEILDRAPKPFNPKATARMLAHSYEQDKFRAWLKRIPEMEEPEINAAPDLWKRVAETETWLWRRADGTYTHRSKARLEGWA